MLFKKIFFLVFIIFIGTTNSLAANFSITPIGTHPTKIRSGDTQVLFFKVKNQTQSTRSNYTLSTLPYNVKQLYTSALYTNNLCGSQLTLTAGAECVLAFEVTSAASFDFSLCNGSSCTRSAASVSLATSTEDTSFPYGSAPISNVAISDNTNFSLTTPGYATPETMLGSWAMKQALANDIATQEIPTDFQKNIVYAVGTAALDAHYGYTESDCTGGGCNQLNGYCFAVKFNQKTSYQYMIFQSVNIAANNDSLDIYMAGGGCGQNCDHCPTFWGTGSSVTWSEYIENTTPTATQTRCEVYFDNYASINTNYPAIDSHTPLSTLQDACTFASASDEGGTSGFNTQNFTDITIIPVYCPTALTQVTGLALDGSVGTIGENNSVKLTYIADLTTESFSNNANAYSPTGGTTQMQDCKAPSSAYITTLYQKTIPDYSASISAEIGETMPDPYIYEGTVTSPSTAPPTTTILGPILKSPYCSLFPEASGYCGGNQNGFENCDVSSYDPYNTTSNLITHTTPDQTTCLQSGKTWCPCTAS
ncbi:MAG: hypothetical protein QNK11_09710 [Legionella sp.]|nr:hypothetical protein [Legionella sp.]